MGAYPGFGQQHAGGLPPNGNVQQTMPVKMAEFAPVLLDELNPAEPVDFQPNAL